IAAERYGLPAGSVNESDGFAGSLLDKIGYGEASPLTRKGQSGGPSDTPAPASDQRRFPVEQSSHRVSPRSVSCVHHDTAQSPPDTSTQPRRQRPPAEIMVMP